MLSSNQVIKMKNKNICKFVSTNAGEKINIACFIFESTPEVMNAKTVLKHSRAILVKQGKFNFFTDGKKYSVKSGDLMFAFSGEHIHADADTESEYMYIDFDGFRSDELFKRFYITPNNRIFSGFDGLIPLWHESISRASETNVDLASESILLYTFSRLNAVPNAKNELINKIIELTEENFTLSELNVAEIANELSYNAKYISHVFKEKMGVSYVEYLTNLRIKYAISLLDNGIDSVKNVAFLSGFSDPLYFSTVFKKIVGVSPRDYKKTK